MRNAIIGLLAVTGLVACGSSPPKDRFYSLSLDAADELATAPVEGTPAQIMLSVIDLPAFLDTRAMAMQVGPNEIHAARHHFWAEPLDDAIARVLVRDIIKAANAVIVPTGTQGEHVCDLRVQFDRFHASDDARVLVSGRYWLKSAEGNEPRDFDVSQGLAGRGYGSAVSALRSSLKRLAGEIGSEVGGCREPEPVA